MNFNLLELSISKYCSVLDKHSNNQANYRVKIKTIGRSSCSHKDNCFTLSFSAEHLVKTYKNGLFEYKYVRSRMPSYNSDEDGLSKFYKKWKGLEAVVIHEYCHMLLPKDAHSERFINLYTNLLRLDIISIESVYQSLTNSID